MSDKQYTLTNFLGPKYWLTWFWLGLLRSFCWLPYRWQMAVGRGIGWLGYWLAPSRRHIAEVNLKLCFPDWPQAKRQEIVKANFTSSGMGIVEMGLAWWLPQRKLAAITHFVGTEHLEAARKSGRGVLLIGGHFTTLDLVGRLLAEHYPIGVTYRASKNKLVNEIMTRSRERRFHLSIDREEVRKFVRALKAEEIIWYAPDQDYGRKVSVFAPFFGVPAATITATARLARLTDAVLIPMRQYRLPNGKGYEIEFAPPIENFPTGDDVEDATIINQVIEAGILKAPEQYMWLHRRFKTRPKGEQRPY